MEKVSMFSLGITPYISASLILSLVTILMPNAARSDSEKTGFWLHILTLLISLLQSYAIVSFLLSISYHGQYIVFINRYTFVFLNLLTLSSGTIILVWCSHRISKFGISNGVSIIIITNILSKSLKNLYDGYLSFINGIYNISDIYMLLIFTFLATLFILIIETGEKRLSVIYNKVNVGSIRYKSKKNFLPVKINFCGIMPTIFASIILAMPILYISLFYVEGFSHVISYLRPNRWIYQICFCILVVFFSYFYTLSHVNPKEISKNLMKTSGFFPNVHPGKDTEEFLHFILKRSIIWGSIYLIVVCNGPIFICYIYFKNIVNINTIYLIIILTIFIDIINQTKNTRVYIKCLTNIICFNAKRTYKISNRRIYESSSIGKKNMQ
jgi:preprotein translocase subunit SecY